MRKLEKMLMEDYDSYAKHARLLTGIHALKPKPKSKTAIAESTTVNSNKADANLPLTVDTANKASNIDAGISLAGVETVAACPSPSAKKPKGDLLLSAVSMDKKKIDVRKKSLKRL